MVEDFELLSRGGEGRVTFWLQLGVCLSLFCLALDLRGGVVERFRSACQRSRCRSSIRVQRQLCACGRSCAEMNKLCKRNGFK